MVYYQSICQFLYMFVYFLSSGDAHMNIYFFYECELFHGRLLLFFLGLLSFSFPENKAAEMN